MRYLKCMRCGVVTCVPESAFAVDPCACGSMSWVPHRQSPLWVRRIGLAWKRWRIKRAQARSQFNMRVDYEGSEVCRLLYNAIQMARIKMDPEQQHALGIKMFERLVSQGYVLARRPGPMDTGFWDASQRATTELVAGPVQTERSER